MRYRMYPKNHPMVSQMLNTSANEVPPPLPKSPPPLEAPQRLDRLLMTTSSAYQSVPEPKTLDTSAKYPSALRNGDINPEVPTQHSNHTPKKVSWNDVPSETIHDDTEHLESETSDIQNNSFTLQDIDEVLGSNSYVSGNTPGVIGAQEVYNDPRQRIVAERMQSTQNRPNVGPEKLSFQEKMKMFAMESGQDATPKSKVKISKAQREIETNYDGTPVDSSGTNNNNSVESMAMISTSS